MKIWRHREAKTPVHIHTAGRRQKTLFEPKIVILQCLLPSKCTYWGLGDPGTWIILSAIQALKQGVGKSSEGRGKGLNQNSELRKEDPGSLRHMALRVDGRTTGFGIQGPENEAHFPHSPSEPQFPRL